jgi:hypothetical protein
MILNENKLFIAIDNRMGGFFMIAEVARLLHGSSEITVHCISLIQYKKK